MSEIFIMKSWHVLQRNIRSIKQFVSMKEEERRSLLRSFTDDEYRDVMNVCARLPNITMEVSSKGKALQNYLAGTR